MESNVIRFFAFLKTRGEIRDWAYEPETFYFEGVKRNPISYTPDIRVIENSGVVRYYEVKGYMDSVSRSKLRRMTKFYPEIEIRLIQSAEYREIAKWKALIPNWE
jgi:hypothetical protein